MNKTPAVLALSDGSIFKGIHFGAIRDEENPVVSEVVFNTSMYGYQEILTDPSYCGQMMCFTASHIGNVGCNVDDCESSKAHVEAVIVKNYCDTPSNFRATQSLSEYMKAEGVCGISGVDTRSLVRHLRDNGSQMGALACGENINIETLIQAAKDAPGMEGKNLVTRVTTKKTYEWNSLPWCPTSNCFPEISTSQLAERPHVVVIDCGVKYNILRLLTSAGFRVSVVPAHTSAEEILAHDPKALFVSNGPGDPATLQDVVQTVKTLLGKLPMFGICLGHQIIAQALGGKTYKLKFGHRGGNHPVRDESTKKIEITVQNHGFAVDADSFKETSCISHINLNDNTVEGLELPDYGTFCIQYHPESSPGPHDAEYLFNRFYTNVQEYYA